MGITKSYVAYNEITSKSILQDETGMDNSVITVKYGSNCKFGWHQVLPVLKSGQKLLPENNIRIV
jgi:hypothetical protein